MNIHMFGIKGNKTKSDLKKVNIPTGSEAHAEDIWSTGEQDALHIPILGAEAEQEPDESGYKPDLLNPFGVYESKEAKSKEAENEALVESEAPSDELSQPIAEELEGVESEDFLPELQFDEIHESELPVDKPEDKEDVNGEDFESVLLHAPIPTLDVEESVDQIIGVYASSELYVKSLEKELSSHSDAETHCFDSSMNETHLQKNRSINMWIVNLSDDDESELLDSILEESAEHPTLYLSGSLSEHCKKRIRSFLEENA